MLCVGVEEVWGVQGCEWWWSVDDARCYVAATSRVGCRGSVGSRDDRGGCCVVMIVVRSVMWNSDVGCVLYWYGKLTSSGECGVGLCVCCWQW